MLDNGIEARRSEDSTPSGLVEGKKSKMYQFSTAMFSLIIS